MADSKAHLDKAVKIAKQVQDRIKKIQDGIGKFQTDMLDTINKGHEAVTNATGRTQKSIDKELKKLQNKYDEKHAAAQKWVDNQLKMVKDWMNEQIDSIQQELKESSARAERQILECSTGKPLSDEAYEGLLKAVPDIPIPRPEIPKLQVPKPPFPYVNIDLTQMAERALEASGANDLSKTATQLASSDITTTGKTIAQSKLNK